MNRVYICFAASDKWYGKLIRKLTKASYNHVYVVYESYLFGGLWAVEIAEDGVVKLPWEKVKPKYYLNDCYLYDYNLDRGLQQTRNMVGKKYDWLGILGFAIKILAKKLFRRNTENTLENHKRLFCSEYVATVLKKAGAFGFEACDPAEMSPGDVLSIIQAQPSFKPVNPR